jgi:hypothetical protein
MPKNHTKHPKNNKKNQPRPKAKAKVAARRASNMMQMQVPPGVALSHCAHKYATAISAPWDPEAQGCCIPTFPSKSSQKSTAWSRFTVTIGTAGIGFVMMSPTLANDNRVAHYSSATFAGTAFSAVATGVSAATINTPWNQGTLTGTSTTPPNVSGRLVSVGMSSQYTGTVLNQGGLVYALVEPNHGNLNNFAVANLSAYQETKISRVTSGKIWLVGAGIDAQEVQYPEYTLTNQSLYPFSQNQVVDPAFSACGAAILGYIFTGVPGNTFQVEIVQHMEYVGAATSTMATPTHSDARGFEMVNTAANRLPQMSVAKPHASVASLMGSALKEISHELAPYARNGVRMIGAAGLTAAGTYLTGNPALGAGLGRLTLR